MVASFLSRFVAVVGMRMAQVGVRVVDGTVAVGEQFACRLRRERLVEQGGGVRGEDSYWAWTCFCGCSRASF